MHAPDHSDKKQYNIKIIIVRCRHDVVAHGGRRTTIQKIRKTDYWIINCNALVRKVIHIHPQIYIPYICVHTI